MGRVRRAAPGGIEVDLRSDLRPTVADCVAFSKPIRGQVQAHAGWSDEGL
jgi:hypothetical protein